MVYSLIKVASHKEGNGYVFDPETTIGIVLEKNEKIDELLSQSDLHLSLIHILWSVKKLMKIVFLVYKVVQLNYKM